MIQISGPGATRNGASNDYEVLTIAKCKELLFAATGTADDVPLQSLIDAVHQSAYLFTGGRIFKRGSAYTQIYSGTGERSLTLKQWPVGTVTSVDRGYILDSTGAFSSVQSYGSADYIVDADRGILRSIGWMSFDKGDHNFKVVFTAGYASGQVPSDILRALADWVGVSLKRADKKSWDVSSESDNNKSRTYTIAEMPRSTEAVLSRYRRVESFIV